MNEFEQYLISNYGLQPGQDVPDDIYERASAEFLQSRTTVPSIAPNASAFDLDRAIPNAAPSAPAVQPRQQEANPLQGTPFDYGRAVPILEQFASDYIDKENLVRGAKYGDKADIETDWMNAREGIYGPALQELGVTPAKAQIAAISVERGKARNMLEALGIPEPQTSGQSAQSPENLAKAKELQGVRAGLVTAAESAATDAQRREIELQVADLDGQIGSLIGTNKLSPLDLKSEIQTTRTRMNAVKEAGGGTVNYMGIPYGPEEFEMLDRNLMTDERNAFLQAQENPGLLRVSRASAARGPKGEEITDPTVIDENYAKLRSTLQEGEWFQDLDNTVKAYGGEADEDKGPLMDRITPGSLKPVLRGAGVVAGDVAEAVAPLITRENVATVGNIGRAVAPSIAAPVQAALSLSEDPGRKLKSGAASAMRNVIASGATGGIPGANYLALMGLEYLSAVGKRAEEEEKKKLAGQ